MVSPEDLTWAKAALYEISFLSSSDTVVLGNCLC